MMRLDFQPSLLPAFVRVTVAIHSHGIVRPILALPNL